MTVPKLLTRIATVGVAAVLTLSGAAALSPASAAPTYWTFKNSYNGKCLTGSNTTSAVWVSTCNDQQQQQWDWVGGNTYKQLKNRATGRCLTTDDKTLNNAVWTSSPCANVRGQLWWYGGSQTGILVNNWSSWLRTSPSGSDAVYATHQTSTYDDQTHWVGYHT